MTLLQRPGARRCAGIVLIAAALGVAPTASAERSIEIVIEPWPPFADEALPGDGFLTQLTKAAFEAAGYDPEVRFIPWARALHDVEQGYREALMGLFYTDERNELYRYTEPMYESPVGLIALADHALDEWESLDQLAEYTIGIGRGFANEPEFDAAVAAGELDVHVAEDHSTHVPMLFAERVDLMAGTVEIIMHNVEEEGYNPSELKVLEPDLQTHEIHVGISRAIDDSEAIRDDFDRGLQQIREDGTYDEILAEYGVVE